MNRSGYAAFVRVTVEKRIALLRRYLFDTVMRFVALYLVFGVLFFGGRRLAPTAIEESLAGIVVGFFVWTMAATAFQSASKQVETEAQWGTLEQIYMSPFGIERVIALNSVMNVLGSLLSGMVILGMMLVTTDTSLAVPVLPVVVLGAMTIAPVVGLGLVLSGLTLIYKRVSGITGLMQLFLVIFVSLPLDMHPLVAAIPLTVGTRLLTDVMRSGGLAAVPMSMVGLLAVKCVGYLLVGFLALNRLQTVARRRGILGQY